jgi:hypothetical protein
MAMDMMEKGKRGMKKLGGNECSFRQQVRQECKPKNTTPRTFNRFAANRTWAIYILEWRTFHSRP